jgi:trimethylguanosine synthase
MGIKMDEDSWETTIPEAVAEYMSMRIKCATVLDGFCGVGSSAIKFARTCPIVLANDRDYAKI